MKTSVIEVRDMLSVLSVQGVEDRIGEVPGVESVTVNYAAGSATVRHDETRLNIADIKSAVRQAEYESDAASPAHSPPTAATPAAPAGEGPKDKAAPGAPPGPTLASAAPLPPAASTSSAPSPGPDAAADPPGGAAPADHAEHGKAAEKAQTLSRLT
ncbi:heavy-metal-associated domain-containing protein [Phenylobacterium sp.]|uniref:heavy-metal-associated domain-containing protein n=1 Tax=Phenylobacterium sp. TaxID=1871053 RepID=UPI00286C8D20|nr:heavy-metal-associated domain-containing protein [Phenylobacterium sp.]